jgi:hypothetical protein
VIDMAHELSVVCLAHHSDRHGTLS